MNAATLSRRYGREPVSAYVDERWRLLPMETGGVAYHRVGRTAITVGSPLGPLQDAREATVAFRQHCRTKGWRPVIFQAATPVEGLRSHVVAREAFLDVSEFSLSGSSMANARHSVARARRDGVTVSWRRWSECDPETRAEVALISRAWSGARPELTFTYGRLCDIPDLAWVGLALSPAGRIEAFSTWRPLPAGPGLVLDLIRRRKDATPGAVELLVVGAVELARSRELSWLSLGSVCHSEDLPRWLRVVLASAAVYGGSGLSSFKAKFRPRWEDRYLALPAGPTGVPGLMALAIAHLRGAPEVRSRPAATSRWRPRGVRWAATAGATAVMLGFAGGAAANNTGWLKTSPLMSSTATVSTVRVTPAWSARAPLAQAHLSRAMLAPSSPASVGAVAGGRVGAAGDPVDRPTPGPIGAPTSLVGVGACPAATATARPAVGGKTSRTTATTAAGGTTATSSSKPGQARSCRATGGVSQRGQKRDAGTWCWKRGQPSRPLIRPRASLEIRRALLG